MSSLYSQKERWIQDRKKIVNNEEFERHGGDFENQCVLAQRIKSQRIGEPRKCVGEKGKRIFFIREVNLWKSKTDLPKTEEHNKTKNDRGTLSKFLDESRK